MIYAEKLRDPRWQKLRLQVMERDKFTCRSCGDNKSELQIHHLKYLDDPWDTPLEQLETLCKNCHETREHIQKLIIDRIRLMETPVFMNGSPIIDNSICFVLHPTSRNFVDLIQWSVNMFKGDYND